MQNQINLSPITQFVQQVRSAELTQSKEVKMTMQQARMLNLALVEIMDKMLQDYDALLLNIKNTDQEVISVSLDGGVFGQE